MCTWSHKITTRLAKMGNNVNQMNHDLVEVNGFDIDCYRAFSSTREAFMCMRLVTNFLPID